MALNSELGAFCTVFYARPIRAIDGDTFMAEISLGFGVVLRKDIRFIGYDAPELTPRLPIAAQKAKAQLSFTLDKYDFLFLLCPQTMTEKHGRVICNVFTPDCNNIIDELDPQYLTLQSNIIHTIKGVSFTPFS